MSTRSKILYYFKSNKNSKQNTMDFENNQISKKNFGFYESVILYCLTFSSHRMISIWLNEYIFLNIFKLNLAEERGVFK